MRRSAFLVGEGTRARSEYDVFISYSHAADGRLAPALQSGLEQLARPWFQRRALRVFRDQTGLSVNPHLWGAISAALDSAEWFVLLASPQSAASTWVQREVSRWCETKSVERILPVLTDGELVWDDERGAFDTARSTALSPMLAELYTNEPLHLDLRWARSESQVDLHHVRFRDAVAQIAAPIRGVAKDDLDGEDVRQHRRFRQVRRLAICALALLLLLAVTASLIAVGQRNEARRQTRVATAQRLAVTAEVTATSHLDTGILVGLEGLRRDDSPATRRGLLAALTAAPGRVAFGHGYDPPIGAMALSPDRQTLAVVSQDGALRLWSMRTGRALTSPVSAGIGDGYEVAYSRDGARLFVGGDTGAQLFDGATLRPVGHKLFPGVLVEWGRFSPDGRVVAVSGADGKLYLARTSDQQEFASPIRVSPVGATDLDFSADGHVLAIGNREGAVDLINVSPGTSSITRTLHVADEGATYAVEFSPDGKTLATSAEDGPVLLWNTTSWQRRGNPLLGFNSYLYDLEFSADGRLLAGAGDDGAVAIWDPTTGRQLVAPLRGLGELVFDLKFDGSSSLLAATSTSVTRWDLQGDPIGRRLGSHRGRISALLRVGDTIFSGGREDGQVRSWRLDGRRSRSFTPGMARVQALDAANGLIMVGGARTVEADAGRGGVVVLIAADGSIRARLSTGAPAVAAVALSPDGQLLAVGDEKGAVTLWDPQNRRLIRRLVPDANNVYAIRFSPDGSRLAASGGSGVVRAYRVADWSQLWQARVGANVNALSWTPDGAALLSGDGLGSIKQLDATSGKTVRTFAPAIGEIRSLQVSRTGDQILAGGDGSAAVLDAASGRLLESLKVGNGVVLATWAPKDKDFVAANADRVSLESVDPNLWAVRACAAAGRNLTHEEWDRLVGGSYRRTCPAFR